MLGSRVLVGCAVALIGVATAVFAISGALAAAEQRGHLWNAWLHGA